MNQPQQTRTTPGKIVGYLAAVFCLFICGSVVVGIPVNFIGASPAIVVILFMTYLILQGALIASLAGRLFSHHNIEQFKFGIASILLATTIVALPLGFANLLTIATESTSIVKDLHTRLEGLGFYSTGATIALYIAIIPLFFLMEGVMSLLVVYLRNRRRNSGHQVN